MAQAQLIHADASYATFTGTILHGASLHGADVSAADLADALTDALTILTNTTQDARTRLP
jgi:uncharacterized protein YjbI with pentapeptide repeats